MSADRVRSALNGLCEREAGESLRDEGLAALGVLEAALEQYADIRHWRVEDDGRRYPLTIWIGPGATVPGPGGTTIAREALCGEKH